MVPEQNPSGVTDRIKEDPMGHIDHDVLRGYVKKLYDKQFKENTSVTLFELWIGALLAKSWDQVANGNLGWPDTFHLDITLTGTGPGIWIFGGANAITWFSAAIIDGVLCFLPQSLGKNQLGSLEHARDVSDIYSSFGSIIAASKAQSWQQYFVARLFLGIGIGAKASIVPIWYERPSASTVLSLQHTYTDAHSANARESEILPKAKRGRLLVLWQVFAATGIFAGSVATYIFRNNWRNQVLTGAIPAFTLLILAYLCCEYAFHPHPCLALTDGQPRSPRWLISQGRYREAFSTLLKLRKERILALEELCFIHFQLHAERVYVLGLTLDYESINPYVHYKDRVWRVLTFNRNRRAAIATFVVMISQQLSGINILGFLASIFFSAAGLHPQPTSTDPATIAAANKKNEDDCLRLSIGFGAANALFSVIAYFLIERKKDDEDEDDSPPPNGAGDTEVQKGKKKKKISVPACLLGRRNLLLWSLAGGAAMLFVLTFLLDLPTNNRAKMGTVTAFVILFTFFYSPGAGAVPFVYSAEVWPNEGREIGMSWAVLWNFIGKYGADPSVDCLRAGVLALLVPRMLQWSPSNTFGLFTGLSVLGFILVWVFVPSTGPSMTLEAMSRKFDEPTREYSRRKLRPGRKSSNTPAALPAQTFQAPAPAPASAPAPAHTSAPAAPESTTPDSTAPAPTTSAPTAPAPIASAPTAPGPTAPGLTAQAPVVGGP
ncbi:MFS general substrate transporter [Glonium stellatum]|uniref:MFS general substrate transporter n=1 Tax=Glonium stellatum TaxID=574774 RepID=A0A8E2JVL3_9PEZI|nr:MFS general substrate transporter [Glonium stellatum]